MILVYEKLVYSANFEIQDAVNSILNEERFNLNVISWCVENNRTIKNISLKRFGKKCNFDSNKIEENGQIFIPINNQRFKNAKQQF